MARICVFCASRHPPHQAYEEAARELGTLLAQEGHLTIYGGTQKGLMATLSTAVRQSKGRSIGIIPEVFNGLKHPEEEIIKAKDFRERKARMIIDSDAFICLAGGYGTLDELSDVLVGRLISAHHKPLVFVNTSGFYNHLFAHFRHTIAEGLAEDYPSLYGIASTPREELDYIASFNPVKVKHPAIKG